MTSGWFSLLLGALAGTFTAAVAYYLNERRSR